MSVLLYVCVCVCVCACVERGCARLRCASVSGRHCCSLSPSWATRCCFSTRAVATSNGSTSPSYKVRCTVYMCKNAFEGGGGGGGQRGTVTPLLLFLEKPWPPSNSLVHVIDNLTSLHEISLHSFANVSTHC